ncbi:CDP-glycerol glycerophosphotransferase family protein [Pseudoalteromonas sp. B530]|uniref:CDP-glycerol glycerophosphotransferase family protein n=1 Tax=Pseudoalteromonas sp. B530 TaxID=2994390 RepID=UPI00224A9882|nr:CDP-glycerol glycerophosphotransferase family protein [Pseudoalteromonas sp. B530]MCX2767486.1 CDP-glycerol glycerophosphotransferase family protein [Pseudoalteromonas sp. B530]
MIAIVGAGSFGQKTANILMNNSVKFKLFDRQKKKPYRDHNINSFDKINPSEISTILIAVSIEPYLSEIYQELIQIGLDENRILPLVYDSAAVMLDTMFEIDKERVLNTLEKNLSNFAEFENSFFNDRNSKIASLNNKSRTNVGFYFLGRAGGFRQHAGSLPKRLEENYNVTVFSDEPPSKLENKDNYILMSQESMQSQEYSELAITTHFYPCSPAQTTKLTLMHMAYDFLLFGDHVADIIQQAENHYIFLASQPSLELHKRLCLEANLTNNVVLIPGGYPKHDQNLIKYEKIKDEFESKAIIYAPTLSSFFTSENSKYTYSIIQALDFAPKILEHFTDRFLIFRPHPEDLDLVSSGIETKRAIAFKELIKICHQHPRCILDSNKSNYIESFAKSAVMISDTSAIAFSYFLTTGKPVIFFSPDQKSLKKNLSHIKYIQDREKIGYCVEGSEELLLKLDELLNKENHKPHSKDGIIFNEGRSEDYLLENMDYIITGKKHPDWWYLKDYIRGDKK